MYIIPIPQKISIDEQSVKLSTFALKTDNEIIKKFASDFDKNGDFPIDFSQVKNDNPEYYTLSVNDNGISIKYVTDEGAFRAFTTLKQIINQAENNEIKKLEIEDFPSIKNRGYMLDISRGKIPNYSELVRLVDYMADLKYNQLQLYLDSFAIEYKNFPEYTKDTMPITKEELMSLKEYCKSRFITMIPNQNSLGHMAAWTAKPELSHLAISNAEGKPSQTLNPLLPESLELVDKIYDGYFDSFEAPFANIGMDEPIDLGKFETKEECEKRGVGEVYTDYLKKVCELVTKKYNKTPMFWDDIIFKHPEQIKNVPKNAIVMQWGYEQEHHFDRNCRTLRDSGLKFYVCPGSSGWGSITGRSDNALFNITSAAECGAYYGAEGFLLTEWGDDGNSQFNSITYIPLAIGGAASWNCMSHDTEKAHETRKDLLQAAKDYVNDNIFKAKGTEFAELVYRMGKYYTVEENFRFNGTDLYHFSKVTECLRERHKPLYVYVYNYMAELRERIAKIDADELCKKEVLLDCDMVLALCRAISHPHDEENNKNIDRLCDDFRELWKERNHPVGYDIWPAIMQTRK